MASGRRRAGIRGLVGRPWEPRAFPLLDLIGQPLESGSHQKQPLAYFRISRVLREPPQHRGLAEVLPALEGPSNIGINLSVAPPRPETWRDRLSS